MKIMKPGILALCLCAAPHLASAQTMQWTGKGYASVNGGAQVGSHTLRTTSTFSIYGEDASVESTQKIKSGVLVEVGGAYRVWGHNLLAGMFFSHTASDTDVRSTSSIPDPGFYGRMRSVTTSQSGAKHSEDVVHLDAIWMIPFAEKLDFGVFAGPSVFFVKQDTVGGVTVTEPDPTVSIQLHSVRKTAAGINLGADVQYMLRPKWGVGGTARYAWGSAKIDGGSKKLTLGGLQLGVGVRYRF